MYFLIKKCSSFYQKDIYELVKSFCPDAVIGMEGQCNKLLFSDSNTYQIICSHKIEKSSITTKVLVVLESGIVFNQCESIQKNEKNLINKSNIKRSVARQVYGWITKLINRKLKWGIITGVRPTQIARDYLLKTNDTEKCLQYLCSQFLMSEEKAQKLIKIAQYQMPFLITSNKNVSIYVHIPFCSTKCAYCSFGTTLWKNTPLKQQDYVKALLKELNYIASVVDEKNLKVETIYIGGGTPTTLDAENLNKLLSFISKTFNTFVEFTVEAGRPDTISKEKLDIIHRVGVTRLSINPQTMKDETLKKVGRAHSVNDFLSAYHLARKVGFDNINCDLIYGLPGESKKTMIKSVNLLKELKPDSITIHALSLKKGAEYSISDISHVNQSEIEECILYADELLVKEHYVPYYLYRQKKMVGSTENTGYCKQGKECRYNIYMMEGVQTILSVGAGAITRLKTNDSEKKIVRIANIKDPKQYIEKIEDIIDHKERMLKKLET